MKKKPGVSRALKSGGRERRRSAKKISGAALGGPGAGAFAGGRAPGAAAVGAGHAAGAGGALVAARNRDGHGALVADLAGDREGGRTRVTHGAVFDFHRIAIGAIAGALLGDDQNAPVAIEVGLRGRIGAEPAGIVEREDRERRRVRKRSSG